MSVRFRFGWVDAGPSPDVLARTTMAALSIQAGGSTVTSVLDRGHRSYRDEIIVPLFPVAEWLVTNWWHLWYEVRDTGEQRPGFDARHNQAFAGDGFVLPNLTMTPWTRGYALARATRERIRRTDGPIDLVEHGPLAIPRRETRPPTRRIHGLVAADTPACVTAPRGPTGTRFLMARALGDYLARASPGPGLLSSLSTDRQAQSRAFAAEFLAPADALRARLAGDSPVEPERTDDLAREFGVSSEVIRRQIENHDLGAIVEY